MRTHVTTEKEIKREWYLIDASDVVLGRLSSEIADILRGKKKPNFSPRLDCGDYCVVVNTARVKITGSKIDNKSYFSHSGYPGGLREQALKKLINEDPSQVVYRAVWGMLPKNKLRDQMIKKLKLYTGTEHNHQANKPREYAIKG